MIKKRVIDEWININNEARPKIRYWVPCAAVEEEDLKQELRLLKERGFGGVELVALSNLYLEVLTGEDGWGTDNWNKMLKVIADTTQELGMTFDITNGPAWPISMPTVKNADDPAAICELTYGIAECPADGYYKGKVPERRTTHEEGKPKLVKVMAYLEKENKILIQDSYQDLSNLVAGSDDQAVLECKLPAAMKGTRWLIFAFYRQPSVHKAARNLYYVIDHFSKAGVKACEEYWEPLLKEFNNFPSMESIFCDSLEYHVSLEWTPEFVEEFERRRGYSILPYLPFIGRKGTYPEPDIPGFQLELPELSDMINADYMETLTECFCENHLASLEKMAEKYGKTIRYQVAYNKPLEVERSALYVGIPENEALGRAAMDFQKTMAAAVHLGRKRRYSFECAAEYANSYGQNYEDLFWWVKRSLMSGMNAQVLHGGSYSGAYHGKYSENGNLPMVGWPGYEAFRKAVSNYWNRTLSVEDARECLDTIARMNSLFLKKAKVDCAIYRQTYIGSGLGSEFCIYPDDGLLSNFGYSYETVSPALLELPVCKVEDGILDKNGVGYKCLIVPEQEAVSYAFLLKAQELLHENFPIVWIGRKPIHGLFYAEWKNIEDREKWSCLMDSLWESEQLIHVDSIQEVPKTLQKHNVLPRVQSDGTMDIITALRVDEENKVNYYALYAYNRVKCTPENPNPDELAASAVFQKGTTKGSYQRPGKNSQKVINIKLMGEGQVYQCNPWSGELLPMDFLTERGYSTGKVAIEEDEMVILAVFEKAIAEPVLYNAEKKVAGEIPVCFKTLELERFGPDSKMETSFLRSHFSEEKKVVQLKELLPWHQIDSSLEEFAGRGTYFGSLFIDKIIPGKRYILHLGDVSDTFQVYVNGVIAPFPDQVLKEADITEMIITGENQLKVVVVSNLYNSLNCAHKEEKDIVFRIPIPYIAKKYGIWETENKKCSVLVIE